MRRGGDGGKSERLRVHFEIELIRLYGLDVEEWGMVRKMHRMFSRENNLTPWYISPECFPVT